MMRRNVPWMACVAAIGLLLADRRAAAQTFGYVTVHPNFMPDPQRLSGSSGGPIQATSINASCRGWVAQAPGHSLNVAGGMAFLRVFVESQSDTTLMIRAPNGQFMCADDTYGTNPGIDAAYGPGVYQIWVGAYTQSNAGPYTLTVTELRNVRPAGAAPGAGIPAAGGMPGAGAAVLDTTGPPTYGALAVASGFVPDPRRLSGVAHGAIDASTIDANCRGFVNRTPNHVLRLSTPSNFLRVYVQSRTDTTLVVRRPDGTFQCNDDAYGLNPSIEGAFMPGEYRIWVGSYSATDTGVYRIGFTEIASNHP